MNKDIITPDRLKDLGFKEWQDKYWGRVLTVRNMHFLPDSNIWRLGKVILPTPTTIKEVEALYSGLYGEKLTQ